MNKADLSRSTVHHYITLFALAGLSCPFHAGLRRRQTRPRWRRDGREIYYLDSDAISRDGQRFLVPVLVTSPAGSPATLVQNWLARANR